MGNFWQESKVPVETKMEALLAKCDRIELLGARLDADIKSGRETVENVTVLLNKEDYEVLLLIAEIVPEFTVGKIAQRIIDQKWQ